MAPLPADTVHEFVILQRLESNNTRQQSASHGSCDSGRLQDCYSQFNRDTESKGLLHSNRSEAFLQRGPTDDLGFDTRHQVHRYPIGDDASQGPSLQACFDAFGVTTSSREPISRLLSTPDHSGHSSHRPCDSVFQRFRSGPVGARAIWSRGPA